MSQQGLPQETLRGLEATSCRPPAGGSASHRTFTLAFNGVSALTLFRMTVCRVHLLFLPLICPACPAGKARGCVTFEAPKVTKSASSAEGFLPTGLSAANRAKPGLRLFCRATSALYDPACKNADALPRTGLHCFARFRAKLIG
jgi:hypothetical protein